MKKIIAGLLMLTCLSLSLYGQAKQIIPELKISKAELEAHLRFLAADELQGRRTTEMGNNVAARYIAEQFRSYGVKSPEAAADYFQRIPFLKTKPASMGYLKGPNMSFKQGENLVILGGEASQLSGKVVYAGYGWVNEESGHDDYKDLDVKGKIVVSISGIPNSKNPYAVFRSMSKKQKIAAEKGAIALIEIYKLSFPWDFFKANFNSEQLSMASNLEDPKEGFSSLPHLWIDAGESGLLETIKGEKGDQLELEIMSSGKEPEVVYSQNVLGIIEGSDPQLKEEYLLLTAHYDHVGTGKNGRNSYTPQDSIFNGARDNGIGTVAVLAAAKALAIAPPKRSVIVMAFTGEEMGLLGSRFYSENPLIPLNKTVFNLNSDGAGYSDKSLVSVLGFGRVGVDKEMEIAAKNFGLEVFANPAPEQNLFDRSDNVNFAKMGIPAPTFSPGFSSFDEAIRKNYHQVSDNPDTIDYDYLLRFCQSFSYTARLIGNREEAPKWKAGDKYEEAAKKLYNY